MGLVHLQARVVPALTRQGIMMAVPHIPGLGTSSCRGRHSSCSSLLTASRWRSSSRDKSSISVAELALGPQPAPVTVLHLRFAGAPF
jgi:hypothetical protein